MKTKAYARIIKDINPRIFNDLKKRVGQKDQVVRVGVPDIPAQDSEGDKIEGTTLALVAAANEFGVPGRIPERPFLKTAIKENKAQFARLNKISLVQMVRGNITPTTALERLGMMAKAAVQKKIRNGPFARNAASTVAAKGSSQPLIDTGNLVQNVAFEVGKKK